MYPHKFMYPLEIESLIPCLSTQWITHMEIILNFFFFIAERFESYDPCDLQFSCTFQMY